jgi:phage-related protein
MSGTASENGNRKLVSRFSVLMTDFRTRLFPSSFQTTLSQSPSNNSEVGTRFEMKKSQVETRFDLCWRPNQKKERVVPHIDVDLFKEDDGSVPVREWRDGITKKAALKCLVRLKRLEELGIELRRPEADYLGNDIYELRVGLQGVNYRMLYFFYGRTSAILSHGLVKRRTVPKREIDLAVKRKKKFEKDPKTHKERHEPIQEEALQLTANHP